MRPPGRSCLLSTFYQLLIISINIHHATSLIPQNSSSSNPISVSTETTSSITHKAAISTTTSTTTTRSISHAAPPQTSVSTTTTSKPLAQPTAIPLKQPKRCKDCLPGNTIGQICYKNTQCVPLMYLCGSPNDPNLLNSTASSNQCMDTTGPATEGNPIDCKDQLCYPENFLPLPPPGVGNVTDFNSSSLCSDGNFFTLYGSSNPGGAVRYTRSCVSQTPIPSKAVVCKPWEYSAQGSCFLKTCGPDMDCLLPLVCKKSNITNLNPLYGLCMSANSTADPGGDGDGSDGGDTLSSHDRLLIGVLVGVCTLLLGVAIGATVCQYRKRRLKQLRLSLSQAENSEGSQSHKSSFLSRLQIAFDIWCCCSLADKVRSAPLDSESDNENGAREARVVSVAESDSQEGLNSSFRSNLIFARRWQWGATRQDNPVALRTRRVGTTTNGVPILQEVEPPPLYHQGPDLPSYIDRNSRNSIPLSPTSRAQTPIQTESPERATLSSPK